MTATMFNQNAEILRRIAEIAKTRDTIQLLTNWKPQVVVVANDSMLWNPNCFTVERTATGTSAITTVAGSPSQVWITGFTLSLSDISATIDAIALISCTVNGQVVTITKVVTANTAVSSNNAQQTASQSFTHPIRVDAGTVINLITIQNANSIASATIHTITNRL